MKNKGYAIIKAFAWILVFVTFAMTVVATARCLKPKTVPITNDAQTTNNDTVLYVVKRDEHSNLYADIVYERPAPVFDLTDDLREKIAYLVAGKAGNKSCSCQTNVANVIYNEMLDCNGDLDKAIEKYSLFDKQKPTSDTYEAVDAVFGRGEWVFDDDVYWFNDVGHPSEFHDSLVFVYAAEGIAYYKAHSFHG